VHFEFIQSRDLKSSSWSCSNFSNASIGVICIKASLTSSLVDGAQSYQYASGYHQAGSTGTIHRKVQVGSVVYLGNGQQFKNIRKTMEDVMKPFSVPLKTEHNSVLLDGTIP
jgi:hypothetical protein